MPCGRLARGLSATRRSATSDLSDAHQRRGLKRVQCAEVRKSSELVCVYGARDVRPCGPSEMTGEGSRGGGGVGDGGRLVKGAEGRQVGASSPVTPIR